MNNTAIMEKVLPLDRDRQQQVVLATRQCITRAGAALGQRFDAITVRFDLRGRAAGV